MTSASPDAIPGAFPAASRSVLAGGLLMLAAAAADAEPARAQTAVPDGCREPGMTVESQVKGDIPAAGPIAIDSSRELDRDVTLEEYIAARLSELGYKVDSNAFWRLVYATDSQGSRQKPAFGVYSEGQSGDSTTAEGFYRLERGGADCPQLSSYSLHFEIEDDGGRIVWRGRASHVTLSASPTVDKREMADRLLHRLTADLREPATPPAGSE